QNSIFINNAAIYGGAISFYYYASVYVINCRFEDNYARGNGSAINAGTKVEIRDSEFIGQSGGMTFLSLDGPISVTNSSFVNNDNLPVLTFGDGYISNTRFISNTKGGLKIWGTGYVYNSQFISNTSFGYNSALGLERGGIYQSYFANNQSFVGEDETLPGTTVIVGDVEVIESIFVNNKAYNTGAIYGGGDLSIVDSLFERNEGGFAGAVSGAQDIWISGTQMIENRGGASGGIFTPNTSEEPRSVHLINSQISGTVDGFGVFVSVPTWIINSQIVNNENGGVVVEADAYITNSLIAEHDYEWYGGLYVSGDLTMHQSSVLSNAMRARENGGGAYVGGKAFVSDSLFQNNHCVDPCFEGGGLFAGQGMTLSNSIFMSNTSVVAGGASSAGPTYITNSHFIGNSAGFRVGGVAVEEAQVFNSTVVGNHAEYWSGGIYVQGGMLTNVLLENNSAQDAGSSLTIGFSDVEASHLTIIQDASDGNAAVFVEDPNDALILSNSIISSMVGIGSSGTVTEDYNLYVSPTTIFTGTVVSGEHSIVGQDPLFVDPAAGNYRLQAGSPAIDAAVDLGVPFDLDGRPRPLGNAPDMGAYESGQVIPLIRFGSTSYAVNEDAGKLLVTITLDVTPTEMVSVQLATADISAEAGADYTAVSETVIFPAGTSMQTVTIPILDDTAVEGAETFKVLLSSPQNSVLRLNNTAVVTISDDDPLEPPEFVLYLPLTIIPE
ncbi:MAG: hypothetical protein KDE51_14410, partial [Anaerolineales bacterium]|nr:hypothetical protein [Anaerolineales bacterium]